RPGPREPLPPHGPPVRRGVRAGRRPAAVRAGGGAAHQPGGRRGPSGGGHGHVVREPGPLGRAPGPGAGPARAARVPGAGGHRPGDRPAQARLARRRDRPPHGRPAGLPDLLDAGHLTAPRPAARGGASPRLLAVAIVVVVVAAGYAAAARLGPRPAPPGWPPASDLTEYTGALHVHSRYSHDGRGSVADIAAAAARAGVRVVFLTDHNTLAPLRDGEEAWHGPTLVLVGAEITTGSGYLLLLDPRPDLPVEARGFALSDLLARYREAGAIVLLAHPDHPRLGWRDELPPVDGIEVFDVFDQVVAAPLPRQLMGLLAYPVNPVMAILSVAHWPRAVLSRWDRMAREGPAIGVLGLDAHGGIELTEETGVRFPSHETAFRLGRLHFVTREPLEGDAA